MKKLIATIAIALLMVSCGPTGKDKAVQTAAAPRQQLVPLNTTTTGQKGADPAQQAEEQKSKDDAYDKAAPGSITFQKDANPAVGYNWWNERSYLDDRIVEMELGEVAASKLKVCSYHGVNGPLSNRHRDECDKIAARGKQIQARRAAEEKRKDDAYDKAHKK